MVERNKKFEVKIYVGSGDICTFCGEAIKSQDRYCEIEKDITVNGKVIYGAGKYHYPCIAKRNYFIVFLDILGFTQFARNATLFEQYNKIKDMFTIAGASKVKGNINNHELILTDLQYFAISDSIIIFQEILPLHGSSDEFEWKEDAFGKLLMGLEALFQEAFKKKIFLRGGISYGEAIISFDPMNKKHIIIGNSYIDAVKLEEIQSWMGIAFHPSMQEFLKNTRFKESLVKYKILPFLDFRDFAHTFRSH